MSKPRMVEEIATDSPPHYERKCERAQKSEDALRKIVATFESGNYWPDEIGSTLVTIAREALE